MADAAMLPPGDAQRARVEAEIARAGAWAEQRWLEVLGSDEHLRIALRQVGPPPGLVQRLRAIPDQSPASPVSVRARLESRLRTLGKRASLRHVAAFLVFLVLGASIWQRMTSVAEHERRLHTVALLAMQDHMNESDMVVRASDRALVARELSRLVDFAVRLPELGRGLTLVGGRVVYQRG